MQRISTILIALGAIIVLGLSFDSAFAQPPTQVTEANIHDWFVQEETTIYTFDNRANGYNFRGDVQLPREDFGDEDEIYTLIFEPGAQIFFSDANGNAGGSLTIRTNNEGAIGRIQALGAAGNMVTLDGVVVGENQRTWGGIIIQTDPRTVDEGGPGGWNASMESGNYIAYCEIFNVAADGGFGNPNGSVLVDAEELGEGQVYVKSCWFDGGGNWTAFGANSGGLYWFSSNLITGTPNWAGVYCVGPLADDAPEFLNRVISNNHITGVEHWAIRVEDDAEDNGWNGAISNNVIEDDSFDPMILCTNSGDARIINNTLIGNNNGNGLAVADAWCTIRNNIVINCDIGIQTPNAAQNVEYQLFSGNDDNVDPAGFANCVEEDPEFVDDANGDLHLFWNSPAINTGDPAAEFNDPDGSLNDIGAFGGPG